VLRLINVYWKAAQIIQSGELGKPFSISMLRIGKPGGLGGATGGPRGSSARHSLRGQRA